MSWPVRDHHAVVGMSRPDLLEKALIGVALQEAVKWVCRETLLARQTLEFDILPSNNAVTLSVTNGQVHMAHEVLWKADTDTDWTPLGPVSFDTAYRDQMWKEDGSPYAFSQQETVLIIYGTPSVDGTLRVTVSYSPTVEVDVAPLPGWAISCVQAKAESLLLAIPGVGANPALAVAKSREANGYLSDLKAKSLFGESGEIQMQVPNNPYQ